MTIRAHTVGLRSTMLVALLLAIGTSCSDQSPTRPPAAISPHQRAGDLAPPTTLDADINGLIDQLFPLQLRPAVHLGWTNIKLLLQQNGPNSKPTRDIKLALNRLVAIMQMNTARLTNLLGETKEHALVRLVLDMELYVYSGPDTPPPGLTPTSDIALGTVQPTTAATIQTPTLHAGVQFPAGSVNEATTVIVTQEATKYPDNCSGPLDTKLCQYPQFYHFNVFPDNKLNQPAKVAVCHEKPGGGRPLLADHDRFQLAHDKPADPAAYSPGGKIVDGIEILQVVYMPTLITCDASDTYNTASAILQHPHAGFWGGVLDRGLLGAARVANAVGRLISPRELQAIDQGGGGLVLEFSHFAVVDPQGVPSNQPKDFSVAQPTVTSGTAETINAYTVQDTGTASVIAYTIATVLAKDTTLRNSSVTLAGPVLNGKVTAKAQVKEPAQNVIIPAGTPPGIYFLGVRITDYTNPLTPDTSYVSARITVVAPPGTPGAQGSWSTIPDMPTARWGLSVVSVGDTIYTIGGQTGDGQSAQTTNVVEAWEAVTGWRTLTHHPVARTYAATAAYNNKIYDFGGWTCWNCVFVFDPTANTWTQLHDAPHKISSGLAFVQGSLIYVATGNSGGGLSSEFDVYNPATDSWTSLQGTPHLHAFPAGGGILGSTLYLAGGESSGGTVDMSDLSIAPITWSQASTISAGSIAVVRQHGVGTFINGSLYLFAGTDAAVNDVPTATLVFTPPSTWWTAAPIPNPRNLPGGLLFNSRYYVFGGASYANGANGTAMKSVDVFTP